MEYTCIDCQPEAIPSRMYPKDRHEDIKTTGCDCCRTRSYRRYSDCDSERKTRSRPFSHAAVRSKYVNLCATVCVLLLVCSLSQSSAAPHKSRSRMDRQKRATSTEENRENPLWGNPCDYNESNADTKITIQYSPLLAEQAAEQIRRVVRSASEYRDSVAARHSYKSFDLLLQTWEGQKYLRNRGEWFRDEILPEEKVVFKPVSDQYLTQLMDKIKVDDEILPRMYKSLKLIVASLHEFSNYLSTDNVAPDDTLKDNIYNTMRRVGQILCQFNTILESRKLPVLPLLDSEVPKVNVNNKSEMEVLIYRDTLNYLEYLEQVFRKMSETKL